MKKIILALALGLPLVVTSQTYNYAPNAIHIPCLSQNGEATLGIGWGRGNAFQSLELQGVYSPMPHLAVMANYFGAREKDVREKLDEGTDFYLWEAGVGAYEKLPNGSASVFAGFGSGDMFSYFGSENTAKFRLRRLFLQPSISYRNNHFQAGLALRLTHLTYAKGEVSYSIELSELQAIQNIEEKSPLFLPELGFNAGLRLKPVTIGMSITTIFPDTDSWDFVRLNAALTVAVDFNLKKKQRQKVDEG